MGNRQAAKRATSRLMKEKRRKRKKGEKEIVFTKRSIIFLFSFCIFFAFSAYFAGKISAQNLEVLDKQIQTGNTEQKREALFQIRNFQTSETSRIAVAALRDADEIVRATAAFSVIYLPKAEAAQVLLPNLQDKSEIVRRETAYALGKVGDDSAVNSLLQILNKDKVFEVRTASAVALGEIGDVSAIGDLVKILQKKPKEDEEFLRRAAARSIGQIAQIVQTNEEKVLTPENFLPDRYKDLKQPKYLVSQKRISDFHTSRKRLEKRTAKQKRNRRHAPRSRLFARRNRRRNGCFDSANKIKRQGLLSRRNRRRIFAQNRISAIAEKRSKQII